MAAADGILAEVVRQSMTGISANGEDYPGAAMWDVRKIAAAFEFELGELTFSEVVSVLEGSNYLTFDTPPIEVPEPHAFAYLDPAGLERGAALLGRYLGVGEFAPASDRIVSLNDNRPLVYSIDNSVVAAAREISKSNTIPPGQKNLILSTIEAGRALLKNPTAYVAAVSALLLKPLYDAYASVIEEVSKPIIQHAIDAVRQLIGL